MNSKKSVISEKYKNINLLTEEMGLIKRTAPWLHFVLDDFIKVEKFKKYQIGVLSKKQKFSTIENDPNYVQFALLKYIPLARVFYSIEFKNLLESLSNTKLSLNTRNLVQLRRMNQDSPAFARHVDDTKTGSRTLLAIFYLSNWQEGIGGEFCLHSHEFEEANKEVVITPIENRLLIFFSDNINWHSIRKTNNWERFSVLSEWIVNKKL